MKKKPRAGDEKYPSLYLEALAYHEAGHAVMAVLLCIPMEEITIGPACNHATFNARVDLDLTTSGNKLPLFKVGLVRVASEPAEKLAPNYSRFATMHKTYPHLKPFRIGVRSDRAKAFNDVCVVYQLLGLAKSTAMRQFKQQYRDLAHELFKIQVNCNAVHRLANALIKRLHLTGAEAKSIILAEGPLFDDGLFEMCGFTEM